MRYKFLIFVLGIFACFTSSHGQTKLTKQDIVQHMKEGKYEEVFLVLESNYLKFPKDPDYLYFTGVCRVQLDYNIPGAINLLMEATRLPAYVESWFYLGKAYLLNYQFDSADEAFGRFSDKATREEKERLQLSMYITMCRNARDICSRSKKINVIKIDTINATRLFEYLNKLKIGGRLEKTGDPDIFSSKTHEGIKFSSGNIVLETKYAFGKKQKDIFLSQNEDIELGKLKNIGNIVNSSNDEEFVFYDETIPAIFFSSQGHNSAGGYDIFISYYDKTTAKWSKPVNLGFPVNTPEDETAYITISGTNRSVLASRRNSAPGKLVVYTFENVQDSPEEPIVIANAQEISRLKMGKQSFESFVKNNSVKEKAVVKSKNEAPAELKNEQSYRNLIHDALNLQIRSDSIKRISDEKKEQLVSTKSEAEKNRLWQEIKALDNRAEEIQLKADVLYKKAREVENEKLGKANQEKVNTQELAQKAFSNKNRENGNPTENPSLKKKAAPPAEIHDIQYRIQAGVFSKQQPDNKFKGLGNIYKEAVNNGSAYKYYVGLYKKVADAEKGLIKVKEAGFKDAYIIGFYNGKIVPLSRVRELELSNQKQ